MPPRLSLRVSSHERFSLRVYVRSCGLNAANARTSRAREGAHHEIQQLIERLETRRLAGRDLLDTSLEASLTRIRRRQKLDDEGARPARFGAHVSCRRGYERTERERRRSGGLRSRS